MKLNLKIGDRVKCIQIYDYKPETVNQIGTVIDNYSLNMVTIEFDNYIGSSSNYKGKHGHCWNIPNESTHLILVSQRTKEERIILKCKTLWNNSKYIKKNPHLASKL